MTTNTLISLVRKKILEAGTEIIDDATLLIYANWAQKDVTKKVFPNSAIKTTTITFVNGVGSLPSDFGTMYADALDINGNVFSEVSIADFNRAGGTERGITIVGGQVKVSPVTTASLPVYYYPTYAELSGAQNPAINEYFDELILYGMMYRVYEDLQDMEMSEKMKSRYDGLLQERINTLSNYEEDAQRGGTMFNGISMFGNGTSNDPNHWY